MIKLNLILEPYNGKELRFTESFSEEEAFMLVCVRSLHDRMHVSSLMNGCKTLISQVQISK